MRSRALAFGCLLIGGSLALIGSGQPWWRAVGEGVVLKFSGTQATGGLCQALAILALAGTLLLLALRTRGRRIIGALLALVGVGLAVVGGLGLRPSADAFGSQVRQVSLADTLSATVWPWIFLGAGVLITIGAALTVITARTWPSRSDRFRPGSGRSEGPASDDPAELWKAMDAGLDPTTDTAKVPYPNVHNRDPGDTMDDTEGRRASPKREE
jgi:uncharacterized membrane protein (TIGR02234 family)